MKNEQQYRVISGKDLKADNGSGYSLDRHLDKTIRASASYVVGWNGVVMDASNINYVEAVSKVSRRWLSKVAPEILNYI